MTIPGAPLKPLTARASLRASVAIAIAAGLALVVVLACLLSAAQGRSTYELSPSIAFGPTSEDEIHSLNYPNCRFGVGGSVDGFDVAALNVGWHVDWSARLSPTLPNGAEFVQVVRTHTDSSGDFGFSPITDTLQLIAQQNPGSIWLIGNEPDSPFQDDLSPELYARAYHHLFALIKQADPAARVGAGNIVQPTPLRFQYLDRFLTAYQQNYGELPPIDIWSAHSYILREIDAADPQSCQSGQACSEPPYSIWGAFIPSGITATRGVLYKYSDMFSLAVFQQRLIDFRQWMRDHGYQNVPLYVTEYGELFPYPPYITPPPYQDENGAYITEERVAAFMTGTFGILLNLKDAAVGYPADDNRLVQRWLWYSVSDPNFGGLLYDPVTHARRPLGHVFYTYTHLLTPAVDVLAVQIEADPPAISDTGHLQTTTLRATLSNIGNVAITQPISVAFYAGSPPSGTLIGMQTITTGLQGCAGITVVSQTWPNLGAGAHPMYADASLASSVSETSNANNRVTGMFLVADHLAYLPLIHR